MMIASGASMKMTRDSILTVNTSETLPKHKFRTRLPQEVVFTALIAATLLATFVIAFTGYQLGHALFTTAAVDLSNGAQLAAAISLIYSVFFFTAGKYSTILEDISATVKRSLFAW